MKSLITIALIIAGAAHAQSVGQSRETRMMHSATSGHFSQLSQAIAWRTSGTTNTYLTYTSEENATTPKMLAVGTISVGERIWNDTGGNCWQESSKLVSLVDVKNEAGYVKHQIPTIQITVEPRACGQVGVVDIADKDDKPTAELNQKKSDKVKATVLVSKLVITNMKSDGSVEHCEGVVRPHSEPRPSLCDLSIQSN